MAIDTQLLSILITSIIPDCFRVVFDCTVRYVLDHGELAQNESRIT